MTTTHKSGDRVKIVGGSYKNRSGSFVQRCGVKMCTIEVDGDSRKSRNLWLHSIELLPVTGDDTDTTDTMTLNRRDYNALLQRINTMQAEMKDMELMLKKLTM